jgi:pilus assembly protein FimV
VRRFMVALGLFWWALPALASVGLGEIEVRSFLNQPLDAEIRVEGASVGDPALAIRVAPEEDYQRVGLTRGAVPPDLVITIDGAGASRVVRLSTQRPVREPYIGLLLEASWSGGRTLREYTLLLDPPVAFAPTRSAPPVLSTAPPAATVSVTPPVAVVAPAVTAPVERPRPGAYRVNRGDTLYGIVRGMGYTGVTDQQVMLAILDANPDGFIGQNINQMRADVTLALPSEAEVSQRSPVLARQEVQRQTEAWRARAAPPQAPPPTVALAPPEDPPAPPPPEEIQPEPSAESAAPSEEPPVATAPVAEVEPEIPVTEPEAVDEPVAAVPEEPVVAEALDSSEEILEDRLEILAERTSDLEAEPTAASAQILEEALLSQQAAMDALRDELVNLRTELADRDQLLSVVSTELARLEGRMQELQGQTPATGAATFGDQPLHQRILADPLLLIMAGTLVLLLLLLLWALFRRPREREIVETQPNVPGTMGATYSAAEDIEHVEPSKARSGALVGGTTGVAVAAASARALGAEEQVSATPGNLGAGEDEAPASVSPREGAEEDVLADVDLYLAYGMNDQAISALEHAINEGHDSLAYRVRLLEAHGANDNADAVRQKAEALRAELGPEDGDWLKRIAAVESLVSRPSDAGTAEGSEAPTASSPSESEPATTAIPEASSAASPKDPGVMEFDTSDFGELGATPAEEDGGPEPSADAKSDENLMQFNLDELESFSGAGETPPDTPAKGAGEGPPDLPPLVFTDEAESATGSGAGGAGPVSSSTDLDSSEVGMKLSLAEAFAEMGDLEGALALLDEIGSAGTEEQLAKVAEIRSKLDRE